MSGDEKFSVFRHWKTNGHVLLLIFLQILFICLFAQFVRYDPTETSSAVPIKTYFLKDEENNCEIVQKEVTLTNGTVVKQKVANTYTHEEGTEILLAYPSKYYFNIESHPLDMGPFTSNISIIFGFFDPLPPDKHA